MLADVGLNLAEIVPDFVVSEKTVGDSGKCWSNVADFWPSLAGSRDMLVEIRTQINRTRGSICHRHWCA